MAILTSNIYTANHHLDLFANHGCGLLHGGVACEFTQKSCIDYGRSSQINPNILIGSDQYWKLMTGEIVKHEQGPIALSTRLGWILSGPVSEREGALPHTTLVTHVLRVDGINENKSLDKELHSFWNMESIGIIESENKNYSTESV